MIVRETVPADLPAIRDIHTRAFGQADEALLVDDILKDLTARPAVSLVALSDDRAVGHILFSAARVVTDGEAVPASLLAPLAVLPEAQGTGVGGQLIEGGIRSLSEAGVPIVFVLGDPGYYGRHGFEPAARRGLAAPYPLPEAYADAWMVRTLRPLSDEPVRGRVVCCDALSRPELWRE